MRFFATLWSLSILCSVTVGNEGFNESENKLRKLAEKRVSSARAAFDAWQKLAGAAEANRFIDEDRTYHLSKRLLDAELSLAKEKPDRLQAFKGHLKRMHEWEKIIKDRVKGGVTYAAMLPIVESYRVEAEYWLAEATEGKMDR
jgi:hypothetical protein